jgi:hypothetical protein
MKALSLSHNRFTNIDNFIQYCGIFLQLIEAYGIYPKYLMLWEWGISEIFDVVGRGVS